MAGSVNVVITGDSRGVDLMVSRLSLLLSPVGMAAFLGGQVTPYLKQRAQSRFASEGDEAVGGPWAALLPATVQIRENLGLSGEHPINRRTGELERWVTDSAPSVLAGAGIATLVYPGNKPVGKLSEKVKTAQTGKRGGGKSTAPRPVLGIDQTDYAAILMMLAVSIEAVGVTGTI